MLHRQCHLGLLQQLQQAQHLERKARVRTGGQQPAHRGQAVPFGWLGADHVQQVQALDLPGQVIRQAEGGAKQLLVREPLCKPRSTSTALLAIKAAMKQENNVEQWW